jgi:glycosyltransferase involved in cell wall biosynthesis
MHIVIYNINSFGGNYEYSKELFNAYRRNANVTEVTLLMPRNSAIKGNGIVPILLEDKSNFKNRFIRKLDYIYKGIINPFKLYRFLKERDQSFVIFNDYDQTTSLIWVPLLKQLKKKHKFGVILHDPDRDMFLPRKWMSAFTMDKVMSLMDIAFHHGFLPEKSYYRYNIPKVTVPHGLYPTIPINKAFYNDVKSRQKCPYILGLIGNIRDEKNYEFIINALPHLPNCNLLVAGGIANSKVPVNDYKKLIADLNLQDKVIWIERYLDDDELNAAIDVSDVVLLYYKSSFTSQSGILNNIAPYSKKLLATDTPSALKEVVQKYKLGMLVPPNDQAEFIAAVNELTAAAKSTYDKGWAAYAQDATWEAHAAIGINNFKDL